MVLKLFNDARSADPNNQTSVLSLRGNRFFDYSTIFLVPCTYRHIYNCAKYAKIAIYLVVLVTYSVSGFVHCKSLPAMMHASVTAAQPILQAPNVCRELILSNKQEMPKS